MRGDADRWRGPGRLGDKPYAAPARVLPLGRRARAGCRAVADGALGWPAVPVSQLVGPAPRFRIRPPRPERVRVGGRNPGLPDRLRGLRRAADPVWLRRDAPE